MPSARTVAYALPGLACAPLDGGQVVRSIFEDRPLRLTAPSISRGQREPAVAAAGPSVLAEAAAEPAQAPGRRPRVAREARSQPALLYATACAGPIFRQRRTSVPPRLRD